MFSFQSDQSNISIFSLGSCPAPRVIVYLAHDPLHALLEALPRLGRRRLDEPRAVPDGVKVQPLRDLQYFFRC